MDLGNAQLNHSVPWDWGNCKLAFFGDNFKDYSLYRQSMSSGFYPTFTYNHEWDTFYADFNGTDQYIESGLVANSDIGNGNEFSVFCRIYIDDSASGTDVFLGSHDSDRFYLAKFSGPHRIFWGIGNTANTGGTVNISSNTWLDLCWSRSGNNVYTIVNDTIENTTVYAGNNLYASEGFHIGSGRGAATQGLHTPCRISNVLVFNSFLNLDIFQTYRRLLTQNALLQYPTTWHLFGTSLTAVTSDSIINYSSLQGLQADSVLNSKILQGISLDSIINKATLLEIDIDSPLNTQILQGLNFNSVYNILNTQSLNSDSVLNYQNLLGVGFNSQLAHQYIQLIQSNNIIPVAWLFGGIEAGDPQYVWVLDSRGKIWTLNPF